MNLFKKVFLVTITSATFILVAPWFAHAQEQEQPNKSALAVSPAILEMILEPGGTNETKVIVINITNFPIPIKAMVRNFIPNEPIFDKSEETEKILDASSWFTVEPADFILQPLEEKDITITVNTPFEAEPGGHYATVFFQPLIPQEFISARNTNLMARVGVLNFLIVKGDIIEQASITNFFTQKLKQFGSIDFTLSFKNEGNIHIMPSGEITIKNFRGEEVTRIPIEPSLILPKTEKGLKAVWDKGFIFGYFTAQASSVYGSENIRLNTNEIGFWVVPWVPILIITTLLTVIAILFILYRYRLKLAIDVLRGKVDNKTLYEPRKKSKRAEKGRNIK